MDVRCYDLTCKDPPRKSHAASPRYILRDVHVLLALFAMQYFFSLFAPDHSDPGAGSHT